MKCGLKKTISRTKFYRSYVRCGRPETKRLVKMDGNRAAAVVVSWSTPCHSYRKVEDLSTGTETYYRYDLTQLK